MGDVLGLLAIAVLTLCAALAVAQMARTARRRRELAASEKPERLRREIAGIDDYIRRLDQAATDDDLNRLERERKANPPWDGSSSR